MDPFRELKILKMLSEDPSLILMFKEKSITENMWKVAIENEPSLFQHVKNPSEQLILLALKEDGANIKYLKHMGIAITPQMIYCAVKNYPGAIFLLPPELRTRSVVEFACTEDPTLMRDVKLKKEFIDRRLRQDPTLVRFLKNPTEDQYCKALEVNPDMCAFIETFTPKMIDIILSKYPDIVQLIPRLQNAIYEKRVSE